MTKHCPFMMVSKILAEVTGVSGIRGCTVTVDTKCGKNPAHSGMKHKADVDLLACLNQNSRLYHP